MGALPRPDVPPGPRRDLVDALHDLHHRAGWPSLRALAREAGCSPTTVSTVFSAPRLPTWGTLELLVEGMGGDVDRFRTLWLAAGPVDEGRPSPPRIAGRRDELARLRHHLVGGTGLLLVSGEAGIGKTRLVSSAMAGSADGVFAASGACLPLSTEVSLLPFADLLRSMYDVDAGLWLKEAVGDCAPYVRGSLRPLLPELDETQGAGQPEDSWSRPRLFAAIGATLSAAAALRPLALVVEDLHWADAATLDLLEHLLVRLPDLRVVATLRTADPSTPATVLEWSQRVRRLPSVQVLVLGPLSREETAEQLALLDPGSADDDLTERIHRRSQGLPLFTEQLAAQAAEDQPLPELLGDLLQSRLQHLGSAAASVTRTLGVADRPLADTVVADTTALTGAEVAEALHELRDRHLVRASSTHEIALRHPLLAEAIRSALVAPELVDEHRRLAAALAASTDPAPAEVAEHWQRAEQPEQELPWRVRAALAAGQRFDPTQEAQHWLRALAVWPEDGRAVGSPPVSRHDAYLAAFDALADFDVERAAAVAEEGLASVTDPEGVAAAELYRRAAVRGKFGDPEESMALNDRAIRIFEGAPPSSEYVKALLSRAFLADGLGRYEECNDLVARATDLSAELGDLVLHRYLLADRAMHLADTGRLNEALEQLHVAATLELDRPDPYGDVHVALNHVCLLEMCAAGADEIAEAARPGLESAAAWGLDITPVAIVRGNVAAAYRVAGRVDEATELIDPEIVGPPTPDRWPTDWERAMLDLLRGRCREADERLDAVSGLFLVSGVNGGEFLLDRATVDLWRGRADTAYARLLPALRGLAGSTEVLETAGLFACAARAAADRVAAGRASDDQRQHLLRELDDLRAGPAEDPFAPHPTFALRPVFGASWAAERARLARQPSLDLWDAAARGWDGVTRPHDAAYCRWRAAQVAIATGQGTVAARMLRRATADARGHAPLSAAIVATAG